MIGWYIHISFVIALQRKKFNDISIIVDLMGHESIGTTHIYLRRSSAEQQEIVDKIITW